MYADTSIPLVNLTRATFRKAELGFLGVCVLTWIQTPRFCGDPESLDPLFFMVLKVNLRAGDLSLRRLVLRPFLIN